MKKYYTPDVNIVNFNISDIITASKIIGKADINASGYEDQGDFNSVFGL